jgi:pSer/pThr/pTyr-binding forkhead associated (FHA) protein
MPRVAAAPSPAPAVPLSATVTPATPLPVTPAYAAPEPPFGSIAGPPLREVRDTPLPPEPSSAPSSQHRVSRPAAPTFSFRTSEPPSLMTCGACQTVNPPDYRFCVTCGASLKRAPSGLPGESRRTEEGFVAAKPASSPAPISASAPAAPPPRAEAPIAPEPRYARPIDEPAAEGKIVGSPVLDIASSGAQPAKVIVCARCHGSCVAGSRFCKFCGAPLEESAAFASAAPAKPIVSAAVESPRPAARPAPQPATPSRGSPTAAFASPVVPAPAPEARSPAAPTSSPLRAHDDVGPTSITERAVTTPKPVAQPEPRPPAKVEAAPGGAGVSTRPQAPDEPGRRAEISVLAGSPVPAEPTNLPPQRAAREGVRRETGRKHPGRLVVIVEDGSEGRSFSLADGQLDIGRTDGDIVLEDDHYVSPRHALLRFLDGQWILRDLDSTNHVYLRIRKPQPLKDGDLLLLGLEVLQFQTVSDGERGLGHAMQHGTLLFGSPATPRRARLCQRTVEGVIRDVFHLFRDETVIGRETGDIVFTADPFLSRRHAVLRRSATTGEFSLNDLDSSNGTFIAIQGEVSLANGDFLRIGQHLFRVDLG